MIEEILRVNLAELTTIRIRCLGCNCTLEMPVSQVLNYAGTQCKCCQATLITTGTSESGTPLNQLSEALGMLVAMKNSVAIEFAVRQPPAAGANGGTP